MREIAALRRRADAEGQGTLAYLLECAEIEARHIADQERRDRAEREAVGQVRTLPHDVP